jgi:putative component of toxin-antitoxin plasmid stabilization module
MFIVKETKVFSKWLLKLKDIKADKSTQSKDIEKAKKMAKEY